jgi:hypothetical protein
MILVLDFDRVLFDTDRFISDLNDNGLGEISRGPELILAIDKAGIKWEDYVDSYALSYLKNTEDEVYIVSSYYSRNRGDNDHLETSLKLFQETKIEKCGITKVVKKVFTVGEEKTQKLAELYEMAKNEGKEICLLDDEKVHIESAINIGYRAIWYQKQSLTTSVAIEKFNVSDKEFNIEKVSSFKEFLGLKNKFESTN